MKFQNSASSLWNKSLLVIWEALNGLHSIQLHGITGVLPKKDVQKSN